MINIYNKLKIENEKEQVGGHQALRHANCPWRKLSILGLFCGSPLHLTWSLQEG